MVESGVRRCVQPDPPEETLVSACALAEGGDATEECVPAEDRAEALASYALRLREGLAENGPWQRSREEWRAEDVELEVGGMGGGRANALPFFLQEKRVFETLIFKGNRGVRK